MAGPKATLRVAGVVVLGVLAFAGTGLSAGSLGDAASFADDAGDDNAAPDIVTVAVTDSTPTAVTLTVAVANYPTLDGTSWFNLYFDTDGDPETGILGGEKLVRYLQEGAVQLLTVAGNGWAAQAPTGIAATYDAGALTITIPRTVLGDADPLGVHVISGRQQSAAAAVYVASDFAPNDGYLTWTGTARPSHADPARDHELAPDITTVRVADTRAGWIRFTIRTANLDRLRGDDMLLAVLVDRDGRKSTGQVGADYALGHVDGRAYLDRWNPSSRRWSNVDRPRVRTRNANGLLVLEVHRSELRDPRRFAFRLVSAVMHFPTGLTFAVDLAPNQVFQYWRYELTNRR